ncbi:GNAT family N-acetyltransferase [Leuconostoc rapi]|uniref:GNAT family N-acetyltransferase n=1 Tax=Leuconostoc rapi TaxID=1406906 RepID=UPI00195832BA|nr:GNAT family N-acetyltransferase [Leuconostoc rapi]MBM7435938.1 putative GNAT family acetyltransferase [Leuconostoc rapi]
MDFQHEPGRYFLQDNDKTLAEIIYTTINDGQTYSINATRVDPSLRGQGIAAMLLDTVIKDAQDNHMTIKAVCPYVKKAFAQNPAKYQEIEYKS